MTEIQTNSNGMIKSRIVEIDYSKAILIFFVVLGHCLEPLISLAAANHIYLFIYTFHMPFFIFFSGYLTKFNLKKQFEMIIVFWIYQVLYSLMASEIYGVFAISLDTPFWIMWYLLSLIVWRFTVPLLNLMKKYAVIVVSVLVLFSLAIGYVDYVDQLWGLSRTIVFYPYFVFGYYVKCNKNYNKKKSHPLLLFMQIVTLAVLVIFIIFSPRALISEFCLYGVRNYKYIGNGLLQRSIAYAAAFLGINLWRQIKFPKENKFCLLVSSNTLYIYLLHGFVMFLMAHYSVLPKTWVGIVLSFVIAIILTTTLAFVGCGYNYLKNLVLKKLKQKREVA